ncbi:hypothetical protein QW180_28140 [Vibrio sinaloensis]|nr:hypothetical protein [Vibrio sinaloensis]
MDWFKCATHSRRHIRKATPRNLLVLLATISLTACGGGGGGGSNSGNGSQAVAPNSPNSYLPTSSQSKWYYSDSTEGTFATTTKVAGQTAQVINYPTGGKEYFVATADSISFAGFLLAFNLCLWCW